MKLIRLGSLTAVLLCLWLAGCVEGGSTDKIRITDNNGPDRAVVAINRNRSDVQALFARKNVDFSQPVLMRAIKSENQIELWAKAKNGPGYRLIKSYEVCNYSGDLGPKIKRGDLQTPEGFYEVHPYHMKSDSAFHLSFDLGFPNPHDRSKGWTGSNLMVHGDCTSEGCFAMRDGPMEEIYTVATLNFEAGHRRFHFHSFPFRLTAKNLNQHKGHPWHAFWTELKAGYDIFATSKQIPNISTAQGRYVAFAPS